MHITPNEIAELDNQYEKFLFVIVCYSFPSIGVQTHQFCTPCSRNHVNFHSLNLVVGQDFTLHTALGKSETMIGTRVVVVDFGSLSAADLHSNSNGCGKILPLCSPFAETVHVGNGKTYLEIEDHAANSASLGLHIGLYHSFQYNCVVNFVIRYPGMANVKSSEIRQYFKLNSLVLIHMFKIRYSWS